MSEKPIMVGGPGCTCCEDARDLRQKFAKGGRAMSERDPGEGRVCGECARYGRCTDDPPDTEACEDFVDAYTNELARAYRSGPLSDPEVSDE